MSLAHYLVSNRIVTMATVLSAFTFVYISAITKAVFDPLFDYIFPEHKLKEMSIILPNGSSVQLGILLLETIRWTVYVVAFYQLFGSHMK